MTGLWTIGGSLLLAAAAIVLTGIMLSKSEYVCKQCGGVFRISPRRAMWVEHVMNDYRLTCPHCGKRGWCRRQAIKEDT